MCAAITGRCTSVLVRTLPDPSYDGVTRARKLREVAVSGDTPGGGVKNECPGPPTWLLRFYRRDIRSNPDSGVDCLSTADDTGREANRMPAHYFAMVREGGRYRAQSGGAGQEAKRR